MNETEQVAGFFVKLGSEAAEKLPLTKHELINTIRTFRYLSRGKALNVLFKFQYGTCSQKEEALSSFCQKQENGNVIIYDFLEKIFQFTPEQFGILANELYHQYQAYDSSFLNITSIKGLPNNCKKELVKVREAMAEEPVLLFRAVERCVLQHKKEHLVSRCVLHLLSENTASQMIALEKLEFKFDYRVLLLPYSKEIANLLLAMHHQYVSNQHMLSSQESFTLPLVELLQKLKSFQSEIIYIRNEKAKI